MENERPKDLQCSVISISRMGCRAPGGSAMAAGMNLMPDDPAWRSGAAFAPFLTAFRRAGRPPRELTGFFFSPSLDGRFELVELSKFHSLST